MWKEIAFIFLRRQTTTQFRRKWRFTNLVKNEKFAGNLEMGPKGDCPGALLEVLPDCHRAPKTTPNTKYENL